MNQLPSRKSPRAEFHNYSGGKYFVTICTEEMRHFFGRIDCEMMHLSTLGEYCEEQLAEIEKHYSYAVVPLFTVMPNHVHAIICIDGEDNDVPAMRTALGVIIGGLKRAVTLFARRHDIEFAWQGRYHDHIIRNREEGNKIADYIKNNVARWADDRFNPDRIPPRRQ